MFFKLHSETQVQFTEQPQGRQNTEKLHYFCKKFLTVRHV